MSAPLCTFREPFLQVFSGILSAKGMGWMNRPFRGSEMRCPVSPGMTKKGGTSLPENGIKRSEGSSQEMIYSFLDNFRGAKVLDYQQNSQNRLRNFTQPIFVKSLWISRGSATTTIR